MSSSTLKRKIADKSKHKNGMFEGLCLIVQCLYLWQSGKEITKMQTTKKIEINFKQKTGDKATQKYTKHDTTYKQIETIEQKVAFLGRKRNKAC
mmetsp:Transcript_58059/g.92227  ORF Transcript_58059/g.92227 Transcript_58059/m.92227 type:complete len:94 (-) Transcript_58059:1467-1748(-)